MRQYLTHAKWRVALFGGKIIGLATIVAIAIVVGVWCVTYGLLLALGGV